MTPDNNDLIKEIENDPKAQLKLYKRYFKKMYSTCLRYAKSSEDAEDIMQEGFIKIFNNFSTFRNEGTLESWMRKIMINTSYNYYKRKRPSVSEYDLEKFEYHGYRKHAILDQFLENDLHILIEGLPEGYKKVFNLSAVQGYTHTEISKMLNISRNTSKTQLKRAKTSLREKISQIYHIKEQNSYYENCLS